MIGMQEWLAARRPIEARLSVARKQLANATRTTVLDGNVGASSGLRERWGKLDLTRQHAIITAVLDQSGASDPWGLACASVRESPERSAETAPELVLERGAVPGVAASIGSSGQMGSAGSPDGWGGPRGDNGSEVCASAVGEEPATISALLSSHALEGGWDGRFYCLRGTWMALCDHCDSDRGGGGLLRQARLTLVAYQTDSPS